MWGGGDRDRRLGTEGGEFADENCDHGNNVEVYRAGGGSGSLIK